MFTSSMGLFIISSAPTRKHAERKAIKQLHQLGYDVLLGPLTPAS